MMCEKCWADAYDFGQSDQVDNYHRLLRERRLKPCSPREQAGQWWDEETQRDPRRDCPERAGSKSQGPK